MTSTIDSQALFEWCRIPAEALENHPQAKIKIKILDRPDDVHQAVAREMAAEVLQNNAAGRPTRWILPCGPTKQYAYFAQIVNTEKISLRNVHAFYMDDCLDWQGRPMPLESNFSYQGMMRRIFYAPIAPELAIPEHQRHSPDVYAIDALRAVADFD
jgi:glucosamine-6-phosphate deaminase